MKLMPNRIIKESIWTSPNLNTLSDLAELHFYRLLPLPDDHGCCEVTPAVVKGRCYPLKDSITRQLIETFNQELENADIIRTWHDNGRTFAWFPQWKKHQRIRALHQRKTPEPPKEVLACRQVTTSDDTGVPLNHRPPKDGVSAASYQKEPSASAEVKHTDNNKKDERLQGLNEYQALDPPSLDVTCRQVAASDRLNPNLNPNPNLNLYPPSEGMHEASRSKAKEPSVSAEVKHTDTVKKNKTSYRLAIFCEEYFKSKKSEYLIGDYRQEGGAAKRTETKIPDDLVFRQAVRAYLASTEIRVVENGHSFMWFIRDLNRWYQSATRKAYDARPTNYNSVIEF